VIWGWPWEAQSAGLGLYISTLFLLLLWLVFALRHRIPSPRLSSLLPQTKQTWIWIFVGLALGIALIRAILWVQIDLLAWLFALIPLGFWGMRSAYQSTRDLGQIPALLPRTFASLGAWTLLALGTPPLPLGFLSPIVLVPWLLSLRGLSKSQAATLTFWTSLPAQAIHFYWIIHVVQAGYWLAIGGGLIVLLIYLSCYPAFLAAFYAGLLQKFTKPSSSTLLGRHPGLSQLCFVLCFGSVWTAVEVLRSWGEMSFPWNPLAAQWGNWPLMLQSTAWIGGFGLSFILIALNLSFAIGISTLKNRDIKNLRSLGPSIPWFVFPVLLLLGLALWGQIQLQKTEPKATPQLTAVLVQPSVPQQLKWDPEFFDALMDSTWNTLLKASLQKADLIVLPETAMPDFMANQPEWELRIRALAQELQSPILIGALDFQADPNPTNPKGMKYFNSIFMFHGHVNPQAANPQQLEIYRKVRLVPFSEALPFNGIIPVVNFVDLGEGDFSPGPGPQIFYTRSKVAWSPAICYEIIYPAFVREQVRLGAGVLVEMTNDGWFGRSTQLEQHKNLVRLRAVENGIPILRATNTGVTAAIDAQGRVLAEIPAHQAGSLRITLATHPGGSFYARIGDTVEWFWVLSLGCITLLILPWGRLKF
jgi:apolipoprotein N-acyltransferase